jgi:ABC-2 type transport system ATP-binding protein
MAVIDVSHLRKAYGERQVLEDVSFSVEPGEIFGIVGPNGAGKTTTVESIAGIRTPDAGTIRVLGLDPRRQRDALRTRLGVQLQSGDLPDKMRVGEALSLYASFYRDPADPERLLADFGLDGHRKTSYGKLSGGLKQRVSIALALIGNPEVAILDELTTGLDPHARRETWRTVSQIRDRGVTVLLVTHYMDEAERLCDRIAVINDGRVAALDTPAGIRALAGPDASLEDAYVTLTTNGSNR